MARGTLIENLGIEIVELRDDALVARMPVDHRTVQPAGVLHGGASVALAETLASWAGYLAVDREQFHVVGQEINANHIRPVFSGLGDRHRDAGGDRPALAGLGDPHRRRRRQARVHLAVHARGDRAAEHLRHAGEEVLRELAAGMVDISRGSFDALDETVPRRKDDSMKYMMFVVSSAAPDEVPDDSDVDLWVDPLDASGKRIMGEVLEPPTARPSSRCAAARRSSRADRTPRWSR